MFLFEDTLLLTKKRKPKKEVGSIAGSEYFDFKAVYRVCVCVCVFAYTCVYLVVCELGLYNSCWCIFSS